MINSQIKLSQQLIECINNGYLKTVDTINHIITTDKEIKTDKPLNQTSLKDLYIIQDDEKLFCNYSHIDTYTYKIILSF